MPDTTMRLVAVVITHNRKAQLEATLARLLESPSGTLAGVVVFDNASDDGTAAFLSGLDDPRLHAVASPENLGGAGGFERAMRVAVAVFDPDWLVLMDDDARPVPGALAAFHAGHRDEAQAWAAAVFYPDGRICDMNRPWINPFRSAGDFARTLLKGRDGFHLTGSHYAGAETVEIDGGSFVGLFVSRAAIERAGYPDGRLFLYGDDVLYTLGISQAGGRIVFDPGLRFDHCCATLSGGPSPVMKPLWKVYYFHRNQIIAYRKAAGPVLFWPVLALRMVQWWRRGRAYADERAVYLGLLRLALADGLRRRTDRPHASILALAGNRNDLRAGRSTVEKRGKAP